MAKAGAGAYSQLQRVGNYVAPQINKAADRLNQQGMQQKQLNADARARKEKRDDAWALDTQVDMTNFEVEATGNADLTGMFVGAAQGGAAKAGKLYGEARALQNIDRKTAEGKKAEAQLVELSFKNLATQSKELKPILDAYAKDYADGKIKEKSYRTFLNGIARSEGKLYLDKNNLWRVRVLVRDETSGEIKYKEGGEPEYIDKSLSDITKGLDKPYYFNPVHGDDGELNKVLTAMGKNKWDEINGQFIDTKQEFGEEQQRSLNDFIKGTLGSDREMYKWYNYATGKEKLTGFNTEDKAIISSYIDNAVKGAYGAETSTRVTPQTQEQREAEQDRNFNLNKDRFEETKAQNKAQNKQNLAKIAAEKYKAENPNVKLTKTKEKEIKTDSTVLKFFDTAKKIGALGEKANDDAVQKVFDESGLGFEITTDWQIFADNEFDIGDVKDITNKNTFKIIKGMARQAGVSLEDTDIRESIKRIQNGETEVNKEGSTKEDNKELTPEELTAKAKALIAKYPIKK